MSRGFDVRFPVTAGTYAIAANLRHGDATDARDYLVEVPVGFGVHVWLEHGSFADRGLRQRLAGAVNVYLFPLDAT